MNKLYYFLIAIAFFSFAFFASADSIFDIQFPIPELGNCADKNACKAYCDDFANKDACVVFAKKYGLIDEKATEKVKELPKTGPGGCKGETECRSYCEDIVHSDECLQFAEKHNLVDKKEIQRVKKLIKETGPGGCRGGEECRTYCSDTSHQEECIEFGKSKGLISAEQAGAARSLLKNGGPGGCKSESECRNYCQDQAHIEDCLNFGEEHGIVSKDDAARIKKAGFAGGPGGCKGEASCREFCENPNNQIACIDWAEQNGIMTKEQVVMARKFAGKTGPGGCRGEQCREFCENPDNSDVCLQYAEREGLFSKEELERAKKFLKVSKEGGPGGCKGVQCKNFCENPANQDECFNFAKKQGLIPKEQEKQFEAGKKIREKVQQSGGPGGCKTDDECRVYCADSSHVEECVAFGAAHAGLSEGDVRNMLKDFQERKFEANFKAGGGFQPPEDFHRFEQDSHQKFEEFKQLEEHFRGGSTGGFPGLGGFPGAPGGFPSGQGGFTGGSEGSSGFVGPGGCTSPVECIKFCGEHKEECFQSGGPQAGARGGLGGGGPALGGEPQPFPQLRRDIQQIEVKHGDLPQGFEQLPDDKKREFFKSKFEEFHDGPPAGRSIPFGRPDGLHRKSGEFPGRPEEFPGRSGEFPEGVPEEFKKDFFEGKGPIPGTPGVLGPFPQQVGGEHPAFQGIGPAQGTTGIIPQQPSSGTTENSVTCQQKGGVWIDDKILGSYCHYPTSQEQQQLQQQRQQYYQQYQQPSSGTLQPPSQEFHPLEGSFTPPPPSTFTQPSPPPASFTQPSPPPPSSRAPRTGFFATILDFFR